MTNESTFAERLALLRRNYHLQAGPLLMLFAVGFDPGAHVLGWTAATLLVLLSLNKAVALFHPGL